MSNLNTKSLSELPIVEKIGKNDKYLIESSGNMKRILPISNSNRIFLDLHDYDMTENNEIQDTTLYNKVLKALDMGQRVYVKSIGYNNLPINQIIDGFSCVDRDSDGKAIVVFFGELVFQPSIGYSDSELYQPVNLSYITLSNDDIPV